MIISKSETPALFDKLVKNESNYDVLQENIKSFNLEMQEKYCLRFAVVPLQDRIIVDDKCLDEFDELVKSLNIN